MGTNKIIGCEGSVKLDSVKTNYSGSEKLKYQWTPSAGLSSDTIANPIATVTSFTTYTVTVSTSTCSASGQVSVSLSPLNVVATANKTIVCSGSAQLMAATNYTGKSTLHYKWTPSTGLSNDTIANPVAKVSSQTMYTVNVSTDTGCSATGYVSVDVINLTANAGVDKTTQCGQTVQLDAVSTNYNGTATLRYKWIPSNGLSNDTIANPKATVNSNTSYTVTVTATSGCTASDVVLVNITPLTVNVGADKTAVCGASVQLGVGVTNYTGTGLKYKWTPSIGLNNDTLANPVTTAGNITYLLTITTPSGCTATDNVAILSTSFEKPVIDFVGINEKNKNILKWNKPTNGKINSFNIYRETNVSNSYLKIGSVPYDSASVFVDTSSNPDVQSNKYKISILDACGSETAMSNYHKTMHLSINKGINTIWNLIWEAYEGFSVSTYNIYRGTTPTNIQIIGSLSGSNTQFSDYTAPAGYVYYQIEAVSSNLASAPTLTQKIPSATDVNYSSRSNIASNNGGENALFQLKDISNEIIISPNPASNKIELVINKNYIQGMKLHIFNLTGSLIIDQDLSENKQFIDLSAFSNGIYILSVTSNKFTGNQRLIIQK
jgi:hypothetical protein